LVCRLAVPYPQRRITCPHTAHVPPQNPLLLTCAESHRISSELCWIAQKRGFSGAPSRKCSRTLRRIDTLEVWPLVQQLAGCVFRRCLSRAISPFLSVVADWLLFAGSRDSATGATSAYGRHTTSKHSHRTERARQSTCCGSALSATTHISFFRPKRPQGAGEGNHVFWQQHFFFERAGAGQRLCSR